MSICLIVGNWKMNNTIHEAQDLASTIRQALIPLPEGVLPVLCPPFLSLSTVHQTLAHSGIALGAQNMHHEPSGAFTGEVSPTMLKPLCQYVIIGHSERRQHLGESNAAISLKVNAALNAGIIPILCVGESLAHREGGSAASFIESQLCAALPSSPTSDLVIAYEPIWAIGTGQAATPDTAQSMMAHIRSVLKSLYGAVPAQQIPLLYGGSVNASNIADFVGQPDINGALVGSASLDASSFCQIIANATSAT